MTRLQRLLPLAIALILPLSARAQHPISTVAGGGPDNGAAAFTHAIGGPVAVAKDVSGNAYIVDAGQSRVIKLDAAGHLTLFAGNGSGGFSGEGGLANQAQLNTPSGIAIDSAGNVFIADNDNGVIREVPGPTPPAGKLTGHIYTVAGTPASNGYGGDGGPATSATLNHPHGIFVDASNNLYIADSANGLIRKFTVGGGITTVAGLVVGGVAMPGYSGDGGLAKSAQLNNPMGLYADNAGNVWVADTNNCLVRKFTVGGNITTFAGVVPAPNPVCGATGDTNLATAAQLNKPQGVFVDGANVFIADFENHAIREVPGASGSSYNIPVMTAGHMYTIAGQLGSYGWTGDGGPSINAQVAHPSNILVDGAHNLFIADYNSAELRMVPATSGTNFTIPMTMFDIYTIAGDNKLFWGGDGGPANQGELGFPSGVAADASGNFYVAETTSVVVRKVASGGGTISTVAGVPDSDGFNGDGLATSTFFSFMSDVAVDNAGNIYVADTDNCLVRKFTVGGGVVTVAGNSSANPPTCAFAGDGGLATSAQLNHPFGIAVDSQNNLFIADSGNHVIREVPAADGKNYGISMTHGNIYTVAGTPTAAGSDGDGGNATAGHLNHPQGVYVDGLGNIFIADTNNHTVRQVVGLTGTNSTAGNISTLAGTPQTPGFGGDTGPATAAMLNHPWGVTADAAGNVFIADSDNQVVREVTVADGNINTVAGTPQVFGFSDNADATKALLHAPTGLAFNGTDLLIADRDTSRIRKVTGAAGTNPGIRFAPSGLTFPDQVLNFPSASQPVVVINTGSAPLAVSVSLTGTNPGDFVIASDNCSPSIPAGARCAVNVGFKPTARLGRSATLKLADTAAGNPQMITLSGNGVEPTADLSATTLAFGNQTVASPSTAQSVTLTNNGDAALTITSIQVTGTNAGDFSLAPASTCSGSLAMGANCTISVTFTPSATGGRAAAVTITDNTTPTTQTITLGGNGIASTVSLSKTVVAFAAQLVGSASTPQSVTLTNTGNVPLSIASNNGIQIMGTNKGDFTLAPAGTCPVSPATLAVNANCVINVTFTPSASGNRTASITITDSAAGSPQSITLSGVGGVPTADLSPNPATLTFTNQNVGSASTAQSVTLKNNGNVALTISSIALGGTNSGDYSLAPASTCPASPATLAANTSCTISVTFTPSGAGNRTASITITDNATPGTQTISLTGTGVAPLTLSLAVASNGSATQTVKAGQTATYNMQLSATGGLPTDQVSVTITCTGAPALTTCNPPAAPVVVTSAAAATFAVTVNTTAATMLVPGTQPRMQLPGMRTLPLAVVVVLLLTALLAWTQGPTGRARTLRLAFSVCLTLLPVSAAAVLTGCASGGGGGGGSSVTHTPGTATGSYTLTVTATSGSKAQSTQLTLVVQ